METVRGQHGTKCLFNSLPLGPFIVHRYLRSPISSPLCICHLVCPDRKKEMVAVVHRGRQIVHAWLSPYPWI